jgi:hypothetical protein
MAARKGHVGISSDEVRIFRLNIFKARYAGHGTIS